MSGAAALLDRLGRPGGVRLGAAHPETVPRLATGLSALDAVLGGGIPRGRITELAGPRSAGRTGLAAAIAASATRAGETIAWVDPADALDPEAAAAADIALARLLWVRPRGMPDALRAAEILLAAGGFGLVLLDVNSASVDSGARAWPPPRNGPGRGCSSSRRGARPEPSPPSGSSWAPAGYAGPAGRGDSCSWRASRPPSRLPGADSGGWGSPSS